MLSGKNKLTESLAGGTIEVWVAKIRVEDKVIKIINYQVMASVNLIPKLCK